MSQKDHLLIFCQREEYQSLEQAIESQCKTQWLKSLMREELPSLLELENSEEDHQKAKEWDLRIKDYMAQRGLKTQAQQKNRLVDIRNIIQARVLRIGKNGTRKLTQILCHLFSSLRSRENRRIRELKKEKLTFIPPKPLTL